ncbi:MAG: IS1634 family transposase [Deltaproteobacteria bacterium]|nr:IS1634 family transposase [Deltaproteobacteria bacterium]
MKLGKLSDAEADMWRSVLKTIKKPDTFLATCDDIVVTDHFGYLDVAVASSIWDFWSLDAIFNDNGIRDVSLAKIARILSVNRCIDPVCKSKIPEWFSSTALPWLLDVDSELINSSRIFRELDAIEILKESICEHLFRTIALKYPNSMESVFYDLSSTTFTGSRCTLMKWGHCKEGYQNHVVLAIVVNKDGLPFYWDVLPGGTADANTITWLIRRLKSRFKTIDTTLVFDRGMVSDDNLSLIEGEQIKYISAMDKSQLEGITGIDFGIFSFLDFKNVDAQANDLKNFTKLNNNTYYQEAKVEGKRRYILCFNPQLFKDQRKAREQAVVNFRAFVDNLNSELNGAKRSRQRKATDHRFKDGIRKFKLTKFVDVSLKIQHLKRTIKDGSEQKIRSYLGTINVNEANMLEAGRLDGFWLLVTNHTEKEGEPFKISPESAIAPYREKVVIESAFRDIKSFAEVSPVHVWKEIHVKAHFTICVLSHLINRTLTLRLHENTGTLTENIVAHERLYSELSSCMIDRIKIESADLSTYKKSLSTEKQKELLERIGKKDILALDIIKN